MPSARPGPGRMLLAATTASWSRPARPSARTQPAARLPGADSWSNAYANETSATGATMTMKRICASSVNIQAVNATIGSRRKTATLSPNARRLRRSIVRESPRAARQSRSVSRMGTGCAAAARMTDASQCEERGPRSRLAASVRSIQNRSRSSASLACCTRRSGVSARMTAR